MVPPHSHRVSRVQWYSGYSLLFFPFAYETFTLCGGPSHALLLGSNIHFAVLTPAIFLQPVWPLPRSLATTCGISVDFFSSPYLDVSVQAVPHAHLWIQCTLTELHSAGFPHSDIHGSMPAFGSPWLFADCCVLRRLLVPRHSPCALCSLTINHALASCDAFLFHSLPVSFCVQKDPFACSRLCTPSYLCVRITWFFGLFLDDNLFVVHMISHMVTLSLPFCLLYLCSVFKVQSWISDVRYWILDLIPIPFSENHVVCGLIRWWALLRVTLCLMAYVFLAVSPRCFRSLVGSSGLEPPTSRLSGVRSNHLSYEPI